MQGSLVTPILPPHDSDKFALGGQGVQNDLEAVEDVELRQTDSLFGASARPPGVVRNHVGAQAAICGSRSAQVIAEVRRACEAFMCIAPVAEPHGIVVSLERMVQQLIFGVALGSGGLTGYPVSLSPLA